MELSKKEQKMLDLLVKDKSNTDVGTAVGLTEGSVRVALHKIYVKLGVRGRTGAAVWWAKNKAKQ